MQEAGGRGTSLPFDDLAKCFVEQRHMKGLRKLAAFSFENHPTCPLPKKTIDYLSDFVRKRAQRVISLYQERERENRKYISTKKKSNKSLER